MPEKKKLTQLVGRVGKDPVAKQAGENNIVEFSIAVSNSYDDGDSTWYQIAVFNENLKKPVQASVFKGATVAVEGSIKSREVQGKVYHNVTAYKVGVVSWVKRDASAGGNDNLPF